MNNFESPTSNEDMEKGWSPSIDEIDAFISNLQSKRESMSEELQTKFQEFERDFHNYKDKKKAQPEGGELKEIEKDLIQRSNEISSALPQERINL